MRLAMRSLLLRAVALLAVQYLSGCSAPRQRSEEAAIRTWAYRHLPAAVESSPGSGRTLDVVVGSVASTPSERARSEEMFNVRLVYETDRQIKVIRVVCRFEGGRMVSPSDADLRALDAAAAGLAIPQ
jgi:hypothetical protein